MLIHLLQLDGSLPNIALMRIAAHHRALGHDVQLRRISTIGAVEKGLFDRPDRIYASLIFNRTRPVAERLLQVRPDAIIGGTGWDIKKKLEDLGISTLEQDYSIYPQWQQSIGFTQRGCRLKCGFCVVPEKEGKVRAEQTIQELWRGDPFPRQLILLDNDFFGQPEWPFLIDQIRQGGFKVAFSQGINARMLTEEAAAAIASVLYYDNQMKDRRIYTAWDNIGDERRLLAGLRALTDHGVKPHHIMVYMLVGFGKAGLEDWEYRRRQLRSFGAVPYPMPFMRTPETVGFQRWIVGAYDKRISWKDWQKAGFRPERLGQPAAALPLFPAAL